MRAYIERHFFGTGALAVVVVALCLGWPVYDGVARADDAADDAILKVRTCIDANDISGSLKEALVKADIIEKDLLQTKVTNGMCKEMLQPIHDGTPARKLVAAQNYIQDIELINGAMREAADEEAARGTDWYFSSDGSLMLFGAIAYTSEQVAAQAQYDGGIEGVEERELQAAAAARVAEDKDASTATRLRQKEAALKKVGASAQEAAAGSRCSLEVEVLDEELKKLKDLGAYEIDPQVPQKMRYGEDEPAGLVISPVTEEMFQEIGKKHGNVAEASESDIGCVKLADRMKANLLPYESGELDVHSHQDDIRDLSSNRDTSWGWEITASKTGELNLLLNLSYAISGKDQEFRQIQDSPVYDDVIEVKSKSDSTQKGTESWWHIW
jgi:hypothetical protein